MSRPMTGKAEVVLEFPDRADVATFDSRDRFDARFTADDMELTLQRTGNTGRCRALRLALEPQVFAHFLSGLAVSVSATAPGEADRRALRAAAEMLWRTLAEPSAEAAVAGERLRPARSADDDVTKLTAEEEVLLLHVME